VVSVRWSDS